VPADTVLSGVVAVLTPDILHHLADSLRIFIWIRASAGDGCQQ
jgi:hypothetical protein